MASRSSGKPGQSAGSGQLRARDIDRVNTRARLDAAYEEGQLGADEYHNRSDRAAKAQTLAQLHRLVADLQASPGTSDLALPQPDSTPSKGRRAGYPAHVRARDGDRAATCVVLDAALGDGQLSEDDHRALIELAGTAKTLGELAELTDDLQRPADAPRGPRPPTTRRRHWFALGLAATAVAAAVAAFLVVDRPAARPAGPPVAELGVIEPIVVPTPNLLTPEGFTHFVTVYRAKFGDTVVDDLTVFPEYASLKRMVPGQPNRLVDYTYRGGFDADRDITTRKPDTPVFDLAAVDLAAFGRLLADAPATLRVDRGAISHVMFGVDTPSRGGAPVQRIRVYVENEVDERGFLEVSPAGTVLRTSPFEG
ncbi:DUF1707 domain-containing protein [Nocardia sp. NPDC050406]|uniref:DUF1707 domain-containing protein n=1 Tax=Nocardia sp. NPDC050406 TaxID=3364318 RepID=UPI0037B2CD15